MTKRNLIGSAEVRQININILVDIGFYYLCINQTIQEQLGLPFIEMKKRQLADGRVVECDVVGPVEITFKN